MESLSYTTVEMNGIFVKPFLRIPEIIDCVPLSALHFIKWVISLDN